MIGLAWMRRIALMGAMAILAAAPSIQAQQAAASTPEGAPSVPDEPGSGSAPIFAPDTSAPARPTPMISSSVQDKLTRFSEMARTREEVRRAFLQQDYEKVLQLSREMRQISRIDERSNFYVVAAQMKMGDRQARERGDSRFQTLELEPSQTLPPIESVGEIAVQEAEERAAQTRAAQERAAQAGFGQPEMADETPTQAETGEGTLIDAAPADAPTGGDSAPGESPVSSDDGSVGREAAMQIAAVMTPAPPVRPAPVSVAPTAPAPASDLRRTILYGILGACAVLLMLLVVVVMRRSRASEELEEAPVMGGRLSALDADDEEDDLEVMERRAESPAGATETWAAGTTQLEEGVTETSSPEPASGAGAGAEETMQAPKDDLEAFFSQMDVPADPSGAASSSSQAPAEVESSETVQSPDDIDQQIAMADSAMIGEVEESSVIDLSSFDDATSEAASTRSEDDDLVTLDVNGETVGFDEDVAPVMPLDVTDPQQAETRQEDSPDDMVSLDAGAAFTTAKTKTSWEVEDDEGDVDTATSTPLTEDLPTTSGDLQAFHADETVDLFQKTETDEVGMPVDEETVTSMSIDDIGQQDTAVDEKPVTIEQVDKKPAEAPESSGEGNAPGEDLFDREYRVGMEDFGREDWASAVHHLSIAAALRPSDAQVKEKLREARARRKASEEG